jgi:hypothetical protein
MSLEIRVLVHGNTDSVRVTVGTNNNNSRQRHGDHRCELQEWKCHCGHHTGSEQDTDSATVAIRDNYKEMSTVSADHRRTTDRTIEAIGTNEQEADSAIVAIRENNKQQSGRDQATGPPERETLQEWKCHCGHHTGSERNRQCLQSHR